MKTPLNTRHAVLYFASHFDGAALDWIDRQGKLCHDRSDDLCISLRDVAHMAYVRDITHVWVDPAYSGFPRETNFEDWTFHYQERRGVVASVSVWQRGRSRPVNIIFPQHTSWYGSEKVPGWLRGESPENILITLHYLEQALGVPIGGSPGRVGWNYLKKLYPEWVETIEGFDWKAAHFTAAAATDIIWHRPLMQSESECPVTLYLHKFDKAAAYPYAASQTDFGVGTPVHLEGEEAAEASFHSRGHPQEVGVWRCSVHALGAIEPAMVPVYEKEGWLAGPIIRLLRAFGHEVTVHEGWVFPERHDVLKKWAEELWRARRSFQVTAGLSDRFEVAEGWKNKHCAELAAWGLKTIMNTMIGMTAFKHFEDDDEMRRPDIRLQTIARHRELTRHNIEKVYKLYGTPPVLVYMDALYYLSDKPNGRLAFSMMVCREGHFGGYRWEGAIKVDWQVLDLLQSTTNEAATLEALNKIGWSMDLYQEQEGM